MDLAQRFSLPLPDLGHSQISDLSSGTGSSALRTPSSHDASAMMFQQRINSHSQSHGDRSLDDLAKEFGIDAHVVQALAQRLAKLP